MHLIKEINTLLQGILLVRKKAEHDIMRSTVGSKRLRVVKNHGTWQYYVIERKGDSNGTYLPVEQRKTAKQIAQRDYAEQVLSVAAAWEERLNAAKVLIDTIPGNAIQTLTHPQSLHPGRAALITPYCLSDANYAAAWEAKPYRTKGVGPEWPVILTNKGERVRSKSEKIIADRLAALHIPYRYEAPLTLRGGVHVHPDFTILDVANRREVYLEHLGMLSRPKYAAENVDRVNRYAASGFKQGIDIFYTFECDGQPISTLQIDSIVIRFLPDYI
ncbi:MAG: hypothetical protein MJ178_05590 [Treponemataceae bacterium]|nr:hypothetical protein [Treponemataceae bacterium]